MENNFKTGAIRDKPDGRDFQYSLIGKYSIPYDWSKDFDIEESVGIIPVKNQQQSSSCGGQSWASYSYEIGRAHV